MSNRLTDRILRAILLNTNDVQGERVSKREADTHLVAHAYMETSEVQQVLHELRRAKKIDVDERRYQPAEGVERPKYRGEK